MLLLQNIITKPWAQDIISAPEFYFQNGQNGLQKWLNIELSERVEHDLALLAQDYEKIQEVARTDQEIKDILDLLFEIISYCDTKAKDKQRHNKYSDKRVLASAAVRMNIWIERLIQFKLNRNAVPNGSPKNAFNYLLEPQENATILSQNHRELISINLFKKPFNSFSFVADLKEYFQEYDLTTNNPDNYTHLLTRIIYSIEKEWKEEVVALMAADNTGWQDHHIEERSGFELSILWNSKTPSGTNKTLDSLRKFITDRGYFNLYYVSGGMVKYKAAIKDFARNQPELDSKDWSSKKVLYYEPNFKDYSDGSKSAKIVFLADSVKKIDPISPSKFDIYSGFSLPRQDNITPLKSEPDDIKIIMPDKPKGKKVMLPLNLILSGPPGTGKTFKIQQEYQQLFADKKDGLIKRKRYDFITFHSNYSYEDFIEGIKPVLAGDGNNSSELRFTREQGIFYRACEKAVQLAGYENLQDCIADTPENRSQAFRGAPQYALFIDEINRANISRVFGELITLIEEDKRLGARFEVTDTLLPSSKVPFGVPRNLHLIGTMNTADKSIALLDIALRRRFEFRELLPDVTVIKDPAHQSFFTALNHRVLQKKGKDFLIGHSYFMSYGDVPLNLVAAMNNKVLPLLAEYFYKKEQEMVAMVKEALDNSDLKQQFAFVLDPNSFNKLVFQSAAIQTVDEHVN